ncbi:MAG: hypothetical protein ACI4SS_01715, partial [Clostridia bacterium]
DMLEEVDYFSSSGNDEELMRLFDNATTDEKEGISLSKFPDSKLKWTEDKVDYFYQLMPEEYLEMCANVEAEVEGAIDTIIHSDEYENMDDDERATLIKETISDIKSDVKKEYVDRYRDMAE